jgi:DNA helicase-2/ATP-dependent DNA helicase PcrA
MATTPTTPEYEAAYARLNTEQKQAVDTIDGPVFVIAGPGTGKTQILTLRIANILQKTDTPPESILALTFTEAGASEMRERLVRMIGTRGHRIRIHTFHGFAESLIARYPDAFSRIVGGQIASDIDRAEMLDAALLETQVTYLRPFGDPLYYHGIVSNAIATLKRENVTPEVLRARVALSEEEYEAIPDKMHTKGKYEGKLKGEFETLAKKIAKTRDLLAVYEAYEMQLTARKRYDFEDVILEAVRALTEDESFRREVQESVFYVHADEHQDANRAQNALLELLVEHDERPNLFIVGDEKQAIYRFQGADLDNVHYFRERFANTTIIALVANYRSEQTILDSALSLIAASPDARLSRVQLQAMGTDSAESRGKDGAPVRLVTTPTGAAEMDFLAAELQGLLSKGIATEEIAVLVRRNKDVSAVAEALAERGIPVSRGIEGNALHNRFVMALIRLLEAIVVPREEQLAGLFSLPGFALSGADVWRIMDYSRREKVRPLQILGSAKLLESAAVSTPEQALKLKETLDGLSRLAATERPATVASAALKKSGLLDAAVSAPDSAESLAALRLFMSALDELSEREHGALVPRALEVLALYEARGMSLTKGAVETPGLIRVITVHRSKGREFGYVYVPMLTERAWSTRARPEHFYVPDILSGSAELEDERRLLYVAVTRAKHAITLSASELREDGKTELPSSLLAEIDPALITHQVISDTTKEVLMDDATHLEMRATRAEKTLSWQYATEPSADDREILQRAFIAQGISPTALNNYLECPWKFFYLNLLRIPEAENKYMLYGTAIHAALKAYADRRTRGDDVPMRYAIENFERELSHLPLLEREVTELRAKGERALSAWWKLHQSSWPARTDSELPLQSTLSTSDGTEFVIRGKLDRMDPLPGDVYSVIDYKTGQPKSRNELLGETKDANGNYYRQLVFYKILLARTEPKRVMTQGTIEFVEPDDKGAIRSETFEISDAEVAELESRICSAAEEILALSFWNKKCINEHCMQCLYRFSGFTYGEDDLRDES